MRVEILYLMLHGKMCHDRLPVISDLIQGLVRPITPSAGGTSAASVNASVASFPI